MLHARLILQSFLINSSNNLNDSYSLSALLSQTQYIFILVGTLIEVISSLRRKQMESWVNYWHVYLWQNTQRYDLIGHVFSRIDTYKLVLSEPVHNKEVTSLNWPLRRLKYPRLTRQKINHLHAHSWSASSHTWEW